MRPTQPCHQRAFTLLELSLVIGILVLLSAMIVPTFVRQLQEDELPRSARQLRSLITLVRANAAFDNKRYRIRFPAEDELDPRGGENQPIIEREDDPIKDPEVFNLVTAPWAVGKTFLGDVWCAEVALGRPTIERIRERRERVAETITEKLKEAFEEYDPYRPPLFVEPDESSAWATFVLTTAPRDTKPDELEDFPQLDLILDGGTGLAWLQRPFCEEELDLFEEKNWPAVLRQDFLDTRVLTEDDVLEIRESQLQGAEVQLQGRELEVQPQGRGREARP
jgi:prepilin-type N-terminal cleavage/methylation domain-containing protein